MGSDGGGIITGKGGGAGIFTGMFELPRVLLISDFGFTTSMLICSGLSGKVMASSSISILSSFEGISSLSLPVKISREASAKRTDAPATLWIIFTSP